MLSSIFGSERLRSLKEKGSYSNDLAWVASSKTLGVLVGVALTPVLTRLYSPDSYGQFAFFNALLQPLALIATLHFPSAFVLPNNERGFECLFRGTFLLTLLISALFLLLGGVYWFFVPHEATGMEIPAYWSLLLGPGIFLFAFPQLLTNWNVRLRMFRKAAPIGLVSRVSIKGSSILLGYSYGSFPGGLLYGEFIGKFLQVVLLTVSIFRKKIRKMLTGFQWKDLVFSFRNYRNYPRYILPGSLLNDLAGHLTIYAFIFAFDASAVGNYTLALGILNIPAGVVVNSIEPVLTKRIRDLYYEKRISRIQIIIKEFYSKVFWIGVIPVIIMFFFGSSIFSFLFGNEWGRSGLYVSILGWFVLYRSMASPLKIIYRVFGKESQVLRLSKWLILSRGVGLSLGIFYGDPYLALVFVTIFNVAVYLLHSFIAIYLVSNDAMFFVGKYIFFGISVFLISWSFHLLLKNVF